MAQKFKINQKVVYPSQGVGIVKEVFEKTFKDQTTLYYKIYIEASDMVVMVPVENAENLGIRQIVSAKEAQEALNLLSDDFEPITSDWKLRYQMNLDLLKKGTVKDIATIVRCLYNRSKVKELPILERKLYDSAKKLLEDEIAFALGKSSKDIEAEIHTKLEPPGAAPKIKHTMILDDDEDDDLMDDISEGNNRRGSDDSDDEDDSADDMGADEDFVVGCVFEIVVYRGDCGRRRVAEHLVDVGEGTGVRRIVGKADEDDEVAEVAVVAATGFWDGTAVLFGYVPSVAALQPLVTRDGDARFYAQGGGVDCADGIGRGAYTLLAVAEGVDPPAAWGLDDSVVLGIVEALIAFIACDEHVDSVA